MTVNTLGASYADGKSRGGAWLLPLVPIAISIFAISALVSYHLRASSISPRTIPQSVVIGVYEFLGWVPACMFFGLVFAWSSIWFVAGSIDRPGRKLLRVLGLTVALAVFGNLDATAPHTGALGAFIGGGISSVLGSFLSHLLMAPVTFLALLFATDSFWMSYFERRVLERTRAELQAAALGTTSDSGVEPAVPEEFKQLARTLPPEAVEVGADAESHADLDAYFERLDRGSPGASAVDDSLDIAAGVSSSSAALEEPEPAPVRLSYFERRRLREEQEAQREALAAAEPAEGSEPAVPEAGVDEPIFEGLGEEIPSIASEKAEACVEVSDDSVVAAGHVELDARGEVGIEVPGVEDAATGDAAAESASSADGADGDAGATYEVRFQPLFASPTADAMREELARDDESDDESHDEGESEHEFTEPASREDDGADAGSEVAADASHEIRIGVGEEAVLDDRDAAPATLHTAEAQEAVDAGEASEGETERMNEPESVSGELQPIGDSTRETEPSRSFAMPESSADPVEAAEQPAKSAEISASETVTESIPEARGDEVETAVTAESGVDDDFDLRDPVAAADLSWQRPRGFLAPVVEDAAAAGEDEAEAAPVSEPMPTEPAADESVVVVAASETPDSDVEPVVSIPRPADPKRQMSLFGGSVDEALLHDARAICQSARRASVVLLQRKLRIDYEQALVVLAQLAERGVLELQEDGTQGRVLH